jgi:hypothetical protein
MRLANERIALEFDDATGSLVQIEQRAGRGRRGVRHLQAPADGRLFRIVAPDEAHWLDRHVDSHTAGRPRFHLKGDALAIRYANTRAVDGTPTGIDAVATVRLPPGADEARFTITVTNRGPHRIQEVWYPRVGGWRGYAGPGTDSLLTGDLYSTDPHNFRATAGPNGYTLCNAHRRRFHGFAFGMTFPFLDISGGGRGLSYIHYPTVPRAGGLVIEDQNESRGECHAAWSWVHQPFLAPGATWTSEPVGIAPYRGDWHRTAERLRAWLETWWRPAPVTPRLRESIGYFNVCARDFMGRELMPLAKLIDCARDLKAHGIEDFCVWDMIMAIYLRPDTGDFLEDAPARLAEFRRVLAEIRALGLQVSTLVNYRLTTAKNRSWPERGAAQAMRSQYGAIRYEHWSKCRGAFAEFTPAHLCEGGASLCQNHPGFQAWAVALTRRLLEFGFNSLFIDQPFETSACFAADHGHAVPAYGHEGATQWVPRAVCEIRSRDPEGYAIGENADIWTSQHIQLWWDWGWAAKRAEVFRYILPESLQSWIIDAHEHQREIGRAFALGFQVSLNVHGLERPLATVPAVAARIKRLAALRHRTAAFTVHGRFRDQVGLTVAPGRATVAACLFDAGDRLGLSVGEASDGKGAGGRVAFTLDLAKHGRQAPARVLLHCEDGSTRPLRVRRHGRSLAFGFRLKRWESAVVEIPVSRGARGS